MRRYMQGTLDYACGIYAIINALSLCHRLRLEQARQIYMYSIEEISANPTTWRAFLRNHTDHYWAVRYMLERWCSRKPFTCLVEQPFSHCLEPRLHRVGAVGVEDNPELFLLDEDTVAETHGGIENAVNDVLWKQIHAWFRPASTKRAAVIRFHRFLPGIAQPVVSHWTTIAAASPDSITLHDASAEANSIHQILKKETVGQGTAPPPVVLVPASLLLLEGLA